METKDYIKKCKYCNAEMPVTSNVCPHCYGKQKMSKWKLTAVIIIAVTVLVILTVLSVKSFSKKTAIDDSSSQQNITEKPVETPQEDYETLEKSESFSDSLSIDMYNKGACAISAIDLYLNGDASVNETYEKLDSIALGFVESSGEAGYEDGKDRYVRELISDLKVDFVGLKMGTKHMSDVRRSRDELAEKIGYINIDGEYINERDKVFEEFKEKNLENIRDEIEDDEEINEFMPLVLDGIQNSYSYLKNTNDSNDDVRQNEVFSEFVLGASYFLECFDIGTVGNQVGEYGWDVIQKVFYSEDFKTALDTFEKFYSEHISKLYDNIYSEGIYKVGTDIAEGEYVFFTNQNFAYFCISKDSNKDKIIANDNFDYNSIMTIRNGEYLELDRAYAVPIGEAEIDRSKATALKVGIHIAQGEYKLIADDGEAYYCIYSDNRQQDIKNNNNFKKQAYVTVKKGEYLILNGCHIE